MPRIWTSCIGVKSSIEFDLIPAITRKEVDAGDKRWSAYAPPWWLIRHAMGVPLTLPKYVLKPPHRKDMLEYRSWYKSTYLSNIPSSHEELLSHDKILLRCFCVNPSACHRVFLAEHLTNFGASYVEEINWQ